MSELVRLCGQAELPERGQVKEFTAGGGTLCVANVDGVICALANVCPHRGGPLSGGMVEEGKVVCPWHAWCFDPISGRASHFPQAGVDVYKVIMRESDVYVLM
jgi:nitrite reductase (NADH) small subunit